MTLNALNPSRMVPVQEDLTTAYNQLEVLRGLESMHRVDKKLASGVNCSQGDWLVLNTDDQLELAGATPKQNTYLVWTGNDRYDAIATGQVTVIVNSGLVVRTTKFDSAASYVPGDGLCVKTVSGTPKLTKATGTEAVVGRVQVVGDGFLVLETVRN